MSNNIPDNLIGKTFELIRLMLREENIEFLTLPTVRRKIESGVPLDDRDVMTWKDVSRLVTTLGDTETIETLARLNEEFKHLVGIDARSITHPYFRTIPTIEMRTFTTYDVQGGPFEAAFPLRISRVPMRLDLSGVPIVDGGSFLAFPYGNNFWAVSLKENLSWTSWLVLRQNLADLGFYDSGITLFEDVSLVNAPVNRLPNGPFQGFGFEMMRGDEWVHLTDGSGEHLNAVVTELMGEKALINLEQLANRLKQSGVTMSSWNDVRINVQTGEVRPGPEMRPILVNGELFSSAMKRAGVVSGPGPYFPDINVYSTGDNSLIASQSGLLGVIDTLYTSIGRDFPSDTIMSKLALEEFQKYLATSGFMFLPDIAQMNQAEILKIINYYFEKIGGDGIIYFLVAILPAVLMSIDPGEWFTAAKGHIDKAAIFNAKGPLDYYWLRLSKNRNLWGADGRTYLETVIDGVTNDGKDKGGKGSPPQGSPAGGGAGLTGGPITGNSPGGLAIGAMSPVLITPGMNSMIMSGAVFTAMPVMMPPPIIY